MCIIIANNLLLIFSVGLIKSKSTKNKNKHGALMDWWLL